MGAMWRLRRNRHDEVLFHINTLSPHCQVRHGSLRLHSKAPVQDGSSSRTGELGLSSMFCKDFFVIVSDTGAGGAHRTGDELTSISLLPCTSHAVDIHAPESTVSSTSRSNSSNKSKNPNHQIWSLHSTPGKLNHALPSQWPNPNPATPPFDRMKRKRKKKRQKMRKNGNGGHSPSNGPFLIFSPLSIEAQKAIFHKRKSSVLASEKNEKKKKTERRFRGFVVVVVVKFLRNPCFTT